MSILKFSGKANPAASSANVKYISRERACDDLSFYNLPELENRADAITYAERRMEEESEKPARGGGIQRNHHRMVLSFDRAETTDAAREQAHEFMRENFPNARAIVSIHQDKKNQTHVHVWVDARGTDERKIRIDKATYKTLDERWAGQYDRHYGTNYEREYKEKKTETRAWKRDKFSGIDRPKPARARDGMTSDKYREKDIRDLGVERNDDEKRFDRDQRFVADGQRTFDDSQRATTAASREIDNSIETNERAEFGAGNLQRAADETVRETEKVYSEFERLGERERGIGRDDSSSRGR
jgi:hypothetical protein